MGGLRRRWLIVIALAGLIIAGSFYDHWRKTAPPEKPAVPVPAAQTAAVADGRPVVHVSGAVNKPGVYEVGPGSRVVDAVNAAGGLAAEADAARVNLAQSVKDGMQVNVPATGAAGHAPGTTAAEAAAGSAGTGKVSINAAGRGELESLPGIGPVLAERIVEYRRANGPFRDVTELKKVNGIGDGKFNRIKDRITL
ncbi:MAG TPA: ComEA family DNA-binding protein [Negativicutes bacterium]|nr:ComEA family DNA-binding protein [Negativicutes bacterium]